MQSPLKASSDRAAELKRTSAAATAEARRLWRQVDLARVGPSWIELLPRLLLVLLGAQLLAARGAEAYVDAALGQQDITKPVEGELNPWGLVGTASDGDSLETLLLQPALTTLGALAAGTARSKALQLGWSSLNLITRTQVADAYRNADAVAGTTRRVTQYVRVLTPPSCSRCAILAGDGRAWNTAFRRHPGDDCISMPTTRDKGMDYRTDPMSYFESLSRSEQDRIFTKHGAQAIRDGADIYAVVNARRRAAGMTDTVTERLNRRGKRIGLDAQEFARNGRGRLRTVNVLGQDTYVTLEGRPVRLPGGGSAPRMMPESIYAIARDQEHAISLLRLHGYIWR